MWCVAICLLLLQALLFRNNEIFSAEPAKARECASYYNVKINENITRVTCLFVHLMFVGGGEHSLHSPPCLAFIYSSICRNCNAFHHLMMEDNFHLLKQKYQIIERRSDLCYYFWDFVMICTTTVGNHIRRKKRAIFFRV